MKIHPFSQGNNTIPVSLTENQFNTFVLPHLSEGKRGPKPKLSLYKIFTYILILLYTGMQWKSLPIAANANGENEIHYTSIYRVFCRWATDGSLQYFFENSVKKLGDNDLLDTEILHGDGTTTAAKKGGDLIGYSGHKHQKGEKIVAIVDRNANVIAPFVVAPANKHESPLFPEAFQGLKQIAKKVGFSIKNTVMSLDSAYDSYKNRKLIFNAGMIPNIKENKRNRQKNKPGPKRIYQEYIFKERFQTVERAFAWEDKFKRLLIRFERISIYHLGMKHIAYALINLRHFCNA
ncbi:MAG: IS5 family transposase [Parachlamydiaceae bacterium]|nr:IS5 family transposase [Parachlamydiaceae bacterium]